MLAAVFATALGAWSASALAQMTVEHAIDTSKSKATFTVTHIFVEHVSGEVPIQSGSIVLRPSSLIPVSASAVLDPSKVSSGDPDRDGSLRSPDFFDVQKFPTWSFVSTKITPRSDAAFEMDGNLTIHGVTQPERLEVTVSGDAEHPVYHAAAQIDRHAFGMSTTRLDPTIGGTADVTLDVTLR
jgi:polyisoprenoid-binding protein YceI